MTLRLSLFAALSGILAAHGALPDSVVMAYASWNECDEQMMNAAVNGANVLTWFAIDLSGDANGKPFVNKGPNLDCVVNKTRTMRAQNLDVTHLISVGGWDQVHPNTSWSGSEWLDVFDAWNVGPDGERIFDGIDWDLEGNDNLASPYNTFTVECLELVGEMSAAAKEKGYYVSMAPAQSYLDVSTSEFSRSLTFPPVADWQQNFTYHGRNAYCYLLATRPDTFDLVSVQLYESFAAANYAITQLGKSPSDYLAELALDMYSGWVVHFEDDEDARIASLGPRECVVRHDQLVVGLIGNPNLPEKVVFISPEDVGQAWANLENEGMPTPRGAMFWNAENDGVLVPEGGAEPIEMAKGLSKAIVAAEARIKRTAPGTFDKTI